MTTREWLAGETEVLAEAIARAPSVLNTQPWLLEADGTEVLLFERTDLVLPFHDPLGRDRAISCGAAVQNLELGLRVLGWRARVALLPEPARPSLVARFALGHTSLPTGRDRDWFAAISRRVSYRRPFARQPVSADDKARLVRASAFDGARAHVLRRRTDLVVLAELLEYDALKHQRDSGYQRELSLWTIRDEATHRHGAGIARSAMPAGAAPSAGLTRPAIAVPDRETLVDRLAHETVLLFVSPSDTRIDHLRTGVAMERTWLAAVDTGLAAAVQTQPLHLPEVRSALIDALAIDGHPQVLMRVGHPIGTVSSSPRRSVADLLRYSRH